MGLRLPMPVPVPVPARVLRPHLEVYLVENREEDGNIPPVASIKIQCVLDAIIESCV